jgi:enoyl-CoA hydratase/carnithine racemase
MLRLEREGPLARLVLDRPEARNAIPLGGWDVLATTLAEMEDARTLIVEGAGAAFSAGADLADLLNLKGDPEAQARFRAAMRRALDALAALPIPTIAWIEGDCYGAGVALAMACDLRVSGPAARFAITPAKLGISYPQEDVHRLVSLVGPGQAARLLLSALPIDGAEAARIGLVDLHDPAGGVALLVEAMVAHDPQSLAALKRGIRLAAQGIRSDAEQDRRFDALVGSDMVARRLEALRRR